MEERKEKQSVRVRERENERGGGGERGELEERRLLEGTIFGDRVLLMLPARSLSLCAAHTDRRLPSTRLGSLCSISLTSRARLSSSFAHAAHSAKRVNTQRERESQQRAAGWLAGRLVYIRTHVRDDGGCCRLRESQITSSSYTYTRARSNSSYTCAHAFSFDGAA